MAIESELQLLLKSGEQRLSLKLPEDPIKRRAAS